MGETFNLAVQGEGVAFHSFSESNDSTLYLLPRHSILGECDSSHRTSMYALNSNTVPDSSEREVTPLLVVLADDQQYVLSLEGVTVLTCSVGLTAPLCTHC